MGSDLRDRVGGSHELVYRPAQLKRPRFGIDLSYVQNQLGLLVGGILEVDSAPLPVACPAFVLVEHDLECLYPPSIKTAVHADRERVTEWDDRRPLRLHVVLMVAVAHLL